MIEDETDKIKIAESKEEALLRNTIESTETRIRQAELELEINYVVLDFLKNKKL